MVKSKLLKVKKWVDLNEAAQRLSLALDESVSALDLMELALDGELTLSVRLPFDKKIVAKKITEKNTPIIEYHKRMFSFENGFFGGDIDASDEKYVKAELEYIKDKFSLFLNGTKALELSADKKSFEYYCDSVCVVESTYGDLEYLEERVFELSMQGSEQIDVMWLIQKNKDMEMDELTNLDGVILKCSDGDFYNLQERFDEEYINALYKNEDDNSILRFSRKFRLIPRHYFPAGSLPNGSEIGMSPSNMSKFEAKLSENDSSYHDQQVLLALGAVLKEITSSGVKKWTQGSLASQIGDKKIANLSERTVNGIFSEANKSLKTMN
ncbi:hypothetical protein [Pseudomonas graminis]